MGTPSPPLENSRYASGLESSQTAETMLVGVARTQTRTYCFQGGEMGSPLHASSCRSICVLTVEDALRDLRGPQSPS